MLDASVVMIMIMADAHGGRDNMLESGLLDAQISILWKGICSGEWKNGTLSVYDA